MGRRKAAATTPGFVGPTPLNGSSRRRAEQRATANDSLGFGQGDQGASDAARRLKPTGFFGKSMPRTTLLDQEVPEGGGAAQPVVEAPADASLAPVTIADIDRAHYADMPVSKGGAKLSTKQRGEYGLAGGDGASGAAALLAEDADPLTNREGFLFFAEDLLPGLRGEGEPEGAAYDPEDDQQRAERLKVAEGLWKELPARERREFVVQAEEDCARTAALRHVAGPVRAARRGAKAGSKKKPDGWHYAEAPKPRRGPRGKQGASVADALREWSSDDDEERGEEAAEEEQGQEEGEEEEAAPLRGAARRRAGRKATKAAAVSGKRGRGGRAAVQEEEEEDEEEEEEEAEQPAARRGAAGRKRAAPAAKAAKAPAARKRRAAAAADEWDGPRSSSEEEEGGGEDADSDAEAALAANNEEGTDSGSEASEEEEEEAQPRARPQQRRRKPAKAAPKQQPAAEARPKKSAARKPAGAQAGKRPAAARDSAELGDQGARKAAAKAAPAAKRARRAAAQDELDASPPASSRGLRGAKLAAAAAAAGKTTASGRRIAEKELFSATWRARA
ncbi:hypothetical protein Rsub_12121 [Raphidocelis subcapitata]|uniref:Uncharacterized protein n=1 Tax=Raphidocelis subcapitata TaxID=307507 RepID=A0A2V0PH62_9CHLO|nr:hypothetical protein Rsub_12121 [Raphidocelis subcapitata]|eukprot:GBF99154.1 hypothetical protein Rsub_12121 [Raphidocelis subcapitata]